MEGIREAVDELNASTVPSAGLRLRQVYDETVYINSAIALVQQNIWVGGSLAALILLLFLRSFRATVVISLAIPVSVVGAFVAMAALGRSINVISLAGLAFAVGMVVDAAIVVLENIYRHKEAGYANAKAAFLGAQQVWGAVLVSALTTVMVFIPILVMQLEAGQLFRDIAVAISVSVMLSLLVSITVIPALSRRLLREGKGVENVEDVKDERAPATRPSKKIALPVIDQTARRFADAIAAFTDAVVRNKKFAFAITTTVTVVALAGAWQFLPKLEYLPEGNRNLLFGVIIPPPGYNLDTMTQIADRHRGIDAANTCGPSPPSPDVATADASHRRFARFLLSSQPALAHLPRREERSTPQRRRRELIPLSCSDAGVPRAGYLRRWCAQLVDLRPGASAAVRARFTWTSSGGDLETILGVALNRRPRSGRHGIVGLFRRRARPRMAAVARVSNWARRRCASCPHRLRLERQRRHRAASWRDTIDAFNDGLRVAEITVEGKLHRPDAAKRSAKLRSVDRTQGHRQPARGDSFDGQRDCQRQLALRKCW